MEMEQGEPRDSEGGVYAQTIQSGKWFMLSAFCQKLLNLATFFILARLLVPGDYGVMTVVLLSVDLLSQLTDFTFGDALTQRKGSIEPYLDPLWTFDILRSLVVGAILFFIAPFVADFFRIQPQFLPLLRMSGLMLVVPAFGSARQIYFYKELNFHKLFIRDISALAAFSIGSICFAFFVSASAWAFFIGYMTQYAVGVVMSYVLYPSRPIISFRFRRIKDLMSYTKWVYGQNFLDLLFTQIDKLVVGRLLNPTDLGLYAKAKDMASIATAMLGSMINKVGLAAFSKVQDRLEKVQEGFLKSIDVLLVFSVPVALLLLLEGGAAVTILLGTKWLGLVVPLKIFAFGNLFLAFVRVVSPVLGALGRPDINFKMNVLQALLSVPFLYVGYRFFGVNGLAYGVVLAWIALLVYAILRARQILKIPKKAFLPAFWSGGIASSTILLTDILLRSIQIQERWPWMLTRLAALGILYFLVLFVTSWRIGNGPWRTFQSIFRELGLVLRKSLNT